VTELTELFVAAANAEAPPSRLEAEEIFRAGRRRRRRGHVSAVSTVLVIALVVTVGYSVRGLLVGVAPAEGRFVATGLLWAGAGDARNFYALRQVCPVIEAVAVCPAELLASVNGGDSWHVRGAVPDAASLRPLGAEVLMVSTPAPTGNSHFRVTAPESWEKITFDGGRTWGDTVVNPDPIASAPAGMRPFSWGNVGPRPNTVYVPDPRTRTVRPLATVPELANGLFNWWNPVDGGFWYTGLDPSTGAPTIAVSRDLGLTWSTVALPGRASLGPSGVIDLAVDSVNGQTAYAVYRQSDQSSLIYRSSDYGSTWVQVDPDRTAAGSFIASLVTPTGAHVVARPAEPGSSDPYTTYLASPDGQEYTPVAMAGLPRPANLSMTDGGGYFAFTGEGAYVSADGLSWRPVYVP
jgi:hypothetical protein